MSIKARTKLVKMSYSLTMKQSEVVLLDYIKKEVENMDIKDKHLDPEFLEYLCNLIENQIDERPTNEKDSKPDKKEIFLNILKALYPNITANETKYAGNIAEFLLKKKMVKKIGQSKVMINFLKKTFIPSEQD